MISISVALSKFHSQIEDPKFKLRKTTFDSELYLFMQLSITVIRSFTFLSFSGIPDFLIGVALGLSFG